MTNTALLGLPFIEASQAQKHVTHNEALRILDAAIQVAVQDVTRTAPPAGPAEGQRHIVAGSPTGAWTGQAKAIATWQDGAWAFLAPKNGWCAWSIADAGLLVFDGSVWRDLRGLAIDNAARVGVNTMAASPNLLSVKSNAALFAAINAADSGSGDVRVQLSKESTANTASVVFSTNYSGRAEFGLIGSDTFKLKVSADGSAWIDAISIDRTTGCVALPAGQLAFPATQKPSSDANTLDDYEEGTFTPVFTSATPPTDVTYATRDGRYTKIGNQVFFYLRINLSSKGSGGSGTMTIEGLPFVCGGATSMSHQSLIAGSVAFPTGCTQLVASVNVGSSAMTVLGNGSGIGSASLVWDNVTNASAFRASGQYSV